MGKKAAKETENANWYRIGQSSALAAPQLHAGLCLSAVWWRDNVDGKVGLPAHDNELMTDPSESARKGTTD